MSRFLKVAGITALVAVLALAAVSAVSAQGPQGGAFGWMSDLGERLHEAIADALGITVEQYDAAIDAAREQVAQEAVDEGLLTEEQADRLQERLGEGYGRTFGRGHGMMGPHMGPGSSVLYVAAEQLEMTVQELLAELEDGKSIAEVAQARGVEVQDIADAWLAERAEFLNAAVEAGRITQEQADEMLAHVEEEVLEHLQSTWPWEHDHEECEQHMLEGLGGFGARRFGRGAGGFGGCGR